MMDTKQLERMTIEQMQDIVRQAIANSQGCSVQGKDVDARNLALQAVLWNCTAVLAARLDRIIDLFEAAEAAAAQPKKDDDNDD